MYPVSCQHFFETFLDTFSKIFDVYANICYYQDTNYRKELKESMTMGEYIKQLRTEREWSQDELGKKVGVNRAAVQKWEKGSVENIKRTTIKKLSDVFGVSPCDLMKWDEEPEQTDPINLIKEKYGSDTYELIELFSKLNEKGKSKILEELSDMVQLQKYTEPVKRDAQKMA